MAEIKILHDTPFFRPDFIHFSRYYIVVSKFILISFFLEN